MSDDRKMQLNPGPLRTARLMRCRKCGRTWGMKGRCTCLVADPVEDPPDRIPYVGTGADGCLRSAQIDEEEIDTLPTGPHQPGWSEATEERRAALLASAARWREQATGASSG